MVVGDFKQLEYLSSVLRRKSLHSWVTVVIIQCTILSNLVLLLVTQSSGVSMSMQPAYPAIC